ncbi:PREDICTED: protein SIEVE ELEMENT OCCLUSION A [Camelina sativa]|uniref:Protein SIEVE ELEMENT OCCLUSION A n=1 Tax=Camelina sativa TaxID=90675 RepID=A0ABM0Y6F9_CAMSA|nr:PREDICTED: protein SIEVE ELEMENT OCCLUSION A [Camelina sativa]
MAQRFQLNPKALPTADPLKRVSLIPRSTEQKLAENSDERRPVVPRTHEEKPFGDQTNDHHVAAPAEHNKVMDHETEKLGSHVPKTAAHHPHPSEDLVDANSRHSLVPRSLGHNSLGGRFGPGKKQAFHKNGRPMFSLSDDRVMADRVLTTHTPDMFFFDVISLLAVVDDIFKSHVPSIDASAPKPPLVFKDYADHTSFETFADLIDQIACEIDCKCLHGGESHGMMTSGLHLDSRNTTTFSVLSLVSKYRWDAKLVLVLAALAVKYGVFLLLAETHATNQLTKSLALIKQLPSIFSRQNALHQRLEKTRTLMQDMVDLTTTIIHIYQLPPNHITAAFTDHVPTAVYWIVRCVLICASHISGVSGFKQDQIMSFMEVSEIHENSERLRKINAYLLEQLKKSKSTIEEGIIEEEYQELIQTFTTIIHVDVIPPLLRLLRPIDFLYHGAGASKRRVGINVLTQKHVLLLVSDLENIEKELYILESLYTEAWQQSFEILWVPVQDFWTEADDAKFEALHMNMRWYVLGEPRKLRRAAMRFVREWWGFKNRPILVALDPKGQVMSTNAFPMVWIWQPFAHPFTTARERDLWSEQEWSLEFLIDGTDPHSLNQLVDGKYICLYGGEDLQWIKNFTSLWRNVARAANIQLEMVYVGKRNPKNGIQPIINTIRDENLSHTLPDLFQIWFFWTRIESMWESKQRMLKARGTKGREGFKDGLKEEEKDLVLQEVVAMLGYGGEGDGWGLVSKASDLMVRAKGNLFSRGLAEYDEWEVNIPTKGFLPALNDHLLMRLPPHHCTRFMLPETAGIIPNEVECTECRRTMEKYYLYQCCLE